MLQVAIEGSVMAGLKWIVLGLALLSAPAWAEDKPPAAALASPPISAPSPKQLELAHRYMLAIHPEKTMEASMRASMPAMIDAMPGPPEERKAMMDDMMVVLAHVREKLYPQMEPIIAETFTEAELEQIVAFYESPIGQTLLSRQPQMAAKLAPYMRDVGSQMMAEMLMKMCARHPSSMCPGAAKPSDAAPKPKS
jgi:hypothetical protein